MSYEVSVEQAVINAGRLMKEGRANAVKLEGGVRVAEQIKAITKAGIPVCAHIGLTPQSVNAFGGFKVQGKTAEAAQQMIDDAPMWIAMIRRIYHQLIPHVPAAVSPMIACARTIKTLYPEAKTVFIGPCIAKKSEAKEPDLAGDVDYVLTFQEVRDIFDFARIDPAQLPEDERDHSSRAGRIYARAGGVSEAVTETVRRLYPHRAIAVRAQKADGVPACKKMINDLLEEKTDANFFEGMGCIGGCVGGPKALIDREAGRENVNQYGDQATYPTPIDNPYVIELLQRLGFDTVEALLEKSDIFTRRF